MEVHFALAHFPIALLVTGGAWLLTDLATGHKGSGQTISVGILLAGTVASIPTVATGLWLAAEHASHQSEALRIHRLVGIAAMVSALLGFSSHWLRQRIANADISRNLLFVCAAALAGTAGALGGEMSHAPLPRDAQAKPQEGPSLGSQDESTLRSERAHDHDHKR